MNPSDDSQTPAHLLHELARESLIERRRARRWSIFFRSITLFLLCVIAFAMLRNAGLPGGSVDDMAESEGHTAVVKVSGVISAESQANMAMVMRGLKRAFDDPQTRGIVLQINSPGGSPVQSGLLYDAIVAEREQHPEVPVHAVLGDVAASGGYYVAAAAENIYANQASIVGSIGVRLDSFGAVGAMQQLGIERRLLTAGEHKALLDPFQPVDEIAVERLQAMLDNVHGQFIAAVTEGRGSRLSDDPTLFSGLVWSGQEAVEKGLIDGLASTQDVAKEIIGAERVLDFTESGDPIARIKRELGITARSVIDVIVDRLLGHNSASFVH